MFVVLSKLVPLFVYPLGLMLLAGAASLVLSVAGFLRWSRVVLVAGLIGLWIAAMPAFANWLLGSLEAEYPPVAIERLPQADVIIVLGGAVGQPLPPRVASDLGDPGDRLLHAARLFRAGKGNNVLVTGGNLAWQASVAPEADLIAELLVELGVPRAAIVTEGRSRNTYENAVNSAAIMADNNWDSALLVTSGAHMPRSASVFARVGIEVTPAPTDLRVRYPLYDSILDFLPDAGALDRTTDALKEYIGRVIYGLRGWT